LVIRNARFVLPEGIVAGELAVEGGVIKEISRLKLPGGEREIDAKGRLVIPGVVDVHAHIYDPQYPKRESFQHGTAAAAAGGVTTLVVMPLDSPVFTPEQVKKTVGVGRRRSIVDFSVHAGNMTAESAEHIHTLASMGVKSFKMFTCAPYGVDEATMEKLMSVVAGVGGIAFVHAEDQGVIKRQTERLLGEGRKDPLAHAESRPNEAEERAVKRVLELASRTGCNLHLAHITTKQGVGALAHAREKHLKATAETCPHYLIFTKENMLEQRAYLKMNPPLKNSEDREALWKGLSNGVIDILATDHAPGTRREKEVGKRDIWAAQAGIPGVETLLPLMLSEGVSKGRLTLERLVDALCTRPAHIFGLGPRKGVIREGSDADLVVLDLDREVTISAEKLHYKVGWTPFEGMKVKGVPVMTISRGEVVAEEGEVLGKPGRGQFLAR